MPVKTFKVECVVPKDRRESLRDLARQCQRMTNRLWQIWLCHHANANSAAKLREHLDADRQWRESGKKGSRPKWPIKAIDKPLTDSPDPKSFYRIISAEFPGVNFRTRGLLTNAWQSLLNSRKAASGVLPGWVSILFGNESLPSFTRPLPIPFDKQNSKLREAEDGIYIDLRIDRDTETGKSIVDSCLLLLNRRKAASMRSRVQKILSGEYRWMGSSLRYDSSNGKWFASLTCEVPSRVHLTLDANRILYVRAGHHSPWRVAIHSSGRWLGSFRFGGDGSHVEHARRKIEHERRSRQEHYRWAGGNQKGRGRRRANAVWTKLASRWRDFIKRYNNEITRQLINLAVSRGCGRIVYLPPTDRNRNSRFLSTAGIDSHRRHQSSWEYFQFGVMLGQKCEREGIEYGSPPKKTKRAG